MESLIETISLFTSLTHWFTAKSKPAVQVQGPDITLPHGGLSREAQQWRQHAPAFVSTLRHIAMPSQLESGRRMSLYLQHAATQPQRQKQTDSE